MSTRPQRTRKSTQHADYVSHDASVTPPPVVPSNGGSSPLSDLSDPQSVDSPAIPASTELPPPPAEESRSPPAKRVRRSSSSIKNSLPAPPPPAPEPAPSTSTSTSTSTSKKQKQRKPPARRSSKVVTVEADVEEGTSAFIPSQESLLTELAPIPPSAPPPTATTIESIPQPSTSTADPTSKATTTKRKKPKIQIFDNEVESDQDEEATPHAPSNPTPPPAPQPSTFTTTAIPHSRVSSPPSTSSSNTLVAVPPPKSLAPTTNPSPQRSNITLSPSSSNTPRSLKGKEKQSPSHNSTLAPPPLDQPTESTSTVPPIPPSPSSNSTSSSKPPKRSISIISKSTPTGSPRSKDQKDKGDVGKKEQMGIDRPPPKKKSKIEKESAGGGIGTSKIGSGSNTPAMGSNVEGEKSTEGGGTTGGTSTSGTPIAAAGLSLKNRIAQTILSKPGGTPLTGSSTKGGTPTASTAAGGGGGGSGVKKSGGFRVGNYVKEADKKANLKKKEPIIVAPSNNEPKPKPEEPMMTYEERVREMKKRRVEEKAAREAAKHDSIDLYEQVAWMNAYEVDIRTRLNPALEQSYKRCEVPLPRYTTFGSVFSYFPRDPNEVEDDDESGVKVGKEEVKAGEGKDV